ncbi:hypothetical protein PCASD_21525 [Puccinia coronata f. sp. avenae]|uniref:Tet-like 2OG-Fe(II) oxygenase domain-containing protein n=1 Tax=Puccinia coronata f. sp. avenae TaxID=200324 RepID=A0A2N5TT85_9BASI|nr:hypothetical protein PCASD_21525 [Puccinia coronata f. sp. avenae]
MMYAHGFRSATTGTGNYANPKKDENGKQLEAQAMKSMKEVDQFLQQRAFLLAPGCLAANNQRARKNNSPSFS